MRSVNIRFSVMSLLLGFTLTSCSPTSDNSLLSDKKDDASSLSVDKTPKSEELFLKLDMASIGPAVTGTKLEVSGECYTSTYNNHWILARKGSTVLKLVDITAAAPGNSNLAQCRNGRFHFSLDVGSLTAGSHQVRVSLEAKDGFGTLVINDAQGAATLSFTK